MIQQPSELGFPFACQPPRLSRSDCSRIHATLLGAQDQPISWLYLNMSFLKRDLHSKKASNFLGCANALVASALVLRKEVRRLFAIK